MREIFWPVKDFNVYVFVDPLEKNAIFYIWSIQPSDLGSHILYLNEKHDLLTKLVLGLYWHFNFDTIAIQYLEDIAISIKYHYYRYHDITCITCNVFTI